jgi:hypothetical protein
MDPAEVSTSSRVPAGAWPSMGERGRLVLLVVLCLVAVVRVAYVLFVPQLPVTSDASGYDAAARRLLATGTFAFPIGQDLWANDAFKEDAGAAYIAMPPNAFTVPGYTAFVAAVYSVVGTGPGRFAAVRVVQALLSVVGLALLFALALRVTRDRAVAWTTLGLAAAYPPNLWANGYLLTESVFVVVLIAMVLLMAEAAITGSRRWFLLAGLAAGLGTLLRPIALALPAALVAYGVWRLWHGRAAGKAWGRFTLDIALLALVAALVIAPWAYRNSMLYGEFVPLTSASEVPAGQGTLVSLGIQPPAVVLAQFYAPTAFASDRAMAKSFAVFVKERWDAATPSAKAASVWWRLTKVWRDLQSPFVFDSGWWSWPHPYFLMQWAMILLALSGMWFVRRKALAVAFLLGSPLLLIASYLATLSLTRYLFPVWQFGLALVAAGAVGLVRLARSRGGQGSGAADEPAS